MKHRHCDLCGMHCTAYTIRRNFIGYPETVCEACSKPAPVPRPQFPWGTLAGYVACPIIAGAFIWELSGDAGGAVLAGVVALGIAYVVDHLQEG